MSKPVHARGQSTQETEQWRESVRQGVTLSRQWTVGASRHQHPVEFSAYLTGQSWEGSLSPVKIQKSESPGPELTSPTHPRESSCQGADRPIAGMGRGPLAHRRGPAGYSFCGSTFKNKQGHTCGQGRDYGEENTTQVLPSCTHATALQPQFPQLQQRDC